MSRIYVISDTHFGDKRILHYERQDFKTVKNMNDTMIKRWNEAVLDHQDIIYILGDFSSLDNNTNKNILNQLRGIKRLIIGNHDTHFSIKEWEEQGFEWVSENPICLDKVYWLSHDIMFINSNMPYVNIHGHIHSNIIYTSIKPNQYVNVSVECINYTPLLFDNVKNRFNAKVVE